MVKVNSRTVRGARWFSCYLNGDGSRTGSWVELVIGLRTLVSACIAKRASSVVYMNKEAVSFEDILLCSRLKYLRPQLQIWTMKGHRTRFPKISRSSKDTWLEYHLLFLQIDSINSTKIIIFKEYSSRAFPLRCK